MFDLSSITAKSYSQVIDHLAEKGHTFSDIKTMVEFVSFIYAWHLRNHQNPLKQIRSDIHKRREELTAKGKENA